MCAFSCGNSDDILFEDVITENCIHNAGSLFAHIDRLLDSSDDDKCTAFNELLSHEFLVTGLSTCALLQMSTVVDVVAVLLK